LLKTKIKPPGLSGVTKFEAYGAEVRVMKDGVLNRIKQLGEWAAFPGLGLFLGLWAAEEPGKTPFEVLSPPLDVAL
jgi:hypothetical protein